MGRIPQAPRKNASEKRTNRKGKLPDLTGGNCLEPEGMHIMDEYLLIRMGKAATAARRRAKELCSTCPVRERCLEDALASEDPPGNWDGMYGGMTPHERKKEVEARNERTSENEQ